MAASTARKSAPKPSFRCTECGWTATKWVGRCGECQAWGSVTEVGDVPTRTTSAGPVTTPATSIVDVDAALASSRPTGVGELDRVLGGGVVSGAVLLVAGEPGIGKSTLLLDACGRAARDGQRVLYVTGEESAAQVRLRAERIEAMARTLFLAAETDLAAVLGHIDAVRPDLVVIDSVQTIGSAQLDGAAGNVAQVREVAAALIAVSKSRGICTFLVGHVTKDGSIAGPRVLEHLVDVVLQFEGERHSRLRLVRAVKNRYGPTDEVGCFDLSDVGIVGLPDPSGLFLSERTSTVPGTCVTVTLEGRRPLVVEVQSLVAGTQAPNPRRATSGLESSRVAMVLAVLDRRAGVALRAADVYLSTIGGVRVTEPASDLAIALAVASATTDRSLLPGTVAFGEVGLAGEIRPVGGALRRLAEAARLGFTTAIVPPGVLGSGALPEGISVIEAPDLSSAMRRALMRLA
ncbi:MAG: DNA repair protein RadA [Rhodoferax sp.]|nr:DNA repair protein RadA [Actinomycetota bacterium]